MGRPKSTRVCDVPECGRKHMALGLCSPHYQRHREYGDPLAEVRPVFVGTDLERLDHYSRLDPETGCIEWTGCLNDAGYGVTMIAGTRRTILVHRLALQARGVDIAGRVVRHLVCDNPPCINPDHLAVGSHADNVQDKVRKGRQRRSAATAMSHAVYVEYEIRSLTETHVADILAEKYGTSRAPIYRAVKKWRNG